MITASELKMAFTSLITSARSSPLSKSPGCSPVSGVRYETICLWTFTFFLKICLSYLSTTATRATDRASCHIPVATHSTSIPKYFSGITSPVIVAISDSFTVSLTASEG